MVKPRYRLLLVMLVTGLLVVPNCVCGPAVLWAGPQHESEDDHSDGDHGGSESHGDDGHSENGHGAEHGDDGHGEGDHAAHGNTNPLSADPDLALFTLAIFALLMLVLGKFAWGPIREALERREQAIADQIAEAQKSRDEAHRLLQEHESKLASAHDEIRGLMDEARKEADQQKSAILEEAEKAAAEQQARAVREIGAAKDAALEELARSEVNRVVDLAGRIVGKELRADDHASMIADAVRRLPSDN